MCFDENGKIESGVELCDGFKAERAFEKVTTRILETHRQQASSAWLSHPLLVTNYPGTLAL